MSEVYMIEKLINIFLKLVLIYFNSKHEKNQFDYKLGKKATFIYNAIYLK